MQPTRIALGVALALALTLVATAATAAVSADEAATLKTTLTPFGAEKAGNKEGTIPAWTGGMNKLGTKSTPRLADPFADEKPLYSITAKNQAQYAEKLTDGTKALFAKYPATFRVDVYPTHRTAAAPQYVYDNTFKNATRTTLVDGGGGPQPKDAKGGIPFPIPKTGAEVIWNHKLGWRWGTSVEEHATNYLVTAEGKRVLLTESENWFMAPYFIDGDPNQGELQFVVKSINSGPPIRAGEGLIIHYNVDEAKTQSWVYVTGQRRVRKLPNPCCDTPAPFAAGAATFDELSVFNGDMSRFDWTLVGKREMLIPYNTNRLLAPPKDEDVITGTHLNPDHVRWELHRVWIVDAALKAGQRHTSPKSRYYIDEDGYRGVLGDRWDAQGQLARVIYSMPIILPEAGGVIYRGGEGVYDLIRGSAYIGFVFNGQKEQIKVVPTLPMSMFSADTLAGEGVR